MARLVKQPPFAAQIQSMPSPLGVNVPLQRGYMIWDRPGSEIGYTGGELGDGRDIIHFLFNPSTVTANYQAGDTSYQGSLMYTSPYDHGRYIPIALQQTVSWDLYFDRTYELNYGGNSSAVNDPAVIGVQADVYQFMQFTGVTYQADQGGVSAIASAAGKSVSPAVLNEVMSTLRTSGLMMYMPCNVFFGNALAQMNGNANSSNLNAVSSQVSYYGFISQWSVNYTHWTSSMVPIRAVISVGFTMMANPPVQDAVAVWRDNRQLGTAFAPGPGTDVRPPGYRPPPNYTGW